MLVEAIAWLAAQPWCSGAVGMFGISWGGFNALQVAARRPPALGAILTVCSTDDRYADDVHYTGGCVLAVDMLPWASQTLVWNAAPPDPEVVGPGWRERWLERLEGTPPYVEAWLAHQRRDAYWRHGSVCEDYAAIRCPVYAVGGWADGYTNAVPRLLEGLSCPRKGLVGPVGARLPGGGRARAGDRLPAGVAALVGPLAQGDRHRRHGRADAACLAPGADPARGPARGAPGPVGGRAGLAAARRPRPRELVLGDGQPRRRARPGAALAPRVAPGDRARLRSLVPVRRRGRPAAATSASTTDSRSSSTRRRSRSASSCSAFPRSGSSSRPTDPARSSRRASATSPPTAAPRSSRAAYLNLTHRESHEHAAAARAGPPLRRVREARRDRPRVPARAPHPPRALAPATGRCSGPPPRPRR